MFLQALSRLRGQKRQQSTMGGIRLHCQELEDRSVPSNVKFYTLGADGTLQTPLGVLLIEDRSALPVAEFQIAIDLTAAFDELLTEFRRATGAAIKGRLEAITDSINEIDGTDRVTGKISDD